MKRVVAFFTCAIIIFSLVAGCGGNKAPKAFSVGYAKVDITYDKNPVNMAGYADLEERFSNGVMDRLYATCVACTDTKGNTVLMFGVDLLNIYGPLFNDIRDTISKEHGIPYENILFGASHTHNGTDQKISENIAVAESNALIKEQCVAAARTALQDRSPAKMYTTFARPEGLNFVRHYVLADGSYLGKRTGYVQKADLIGHPHKADNLLQLVKFTREEGKDVVMINWQAHYFSSSQINYNGISADYPGVLREALEKELDCHASFYLGGSGNLASTSQIPSENISSDYMDHGKRLAVYAVEAAANFKEAKLGDIYTKCENLVYEDGIIQVEGPPIYAVGFGEFGIVWAPFEIYDTNARNVREASKFKYTFYATCANSSYGELYLPDAEGFTYPTYEALGADVVDNPRYTHYPAGTAEILQDQLIRMMDELFVATGSEEQIRDEGYMTPEFIPVSDGVEYTNRTLGLMEAITEGENGLYCFTLFANGQGKKMLAINKEVAEQVMNKSAMKLIFDERNVIVAIAE